MAILKAANEDAPRERLIFYADCFCEYAEATENIERNGVIVANPRTGAPMQNPYLTVRERAMAKLKPMMRRINGDALWAKIDVLTD
ncbi:P27 family phage terminase small subunit [Allorhodopirellula heiligendammensis]|nr:P27 family phage terminase small subunit [Allorhodopirellula heiligendammensis]